MDKYENIIRQSHNFSMPRLIEICRSMLPQRYVHRPYTHPELKNGVALLRSEEGMNAYIAAYGEMHMVKCRAALQNFPFDSINSSIEIIDWGCGQGIGSLCVIDALKQHNKENWLKQVTLIEPSSSTLKRAIVNINKATSGSVIINPINEFMPPSESNISQSYLSNISYRSHYVIHVFSNILDVTSIDICRLAQMVSASGHEHFILCMGPMNGNSYRIYQFSSIFGEQQLFSDIADKAYGMTSDTYYTYTCKTKCFRYDGRSLDFSHIGNYVPKQPIQRIENEYDPQMAVMNGLISQSLCDLYKMFCSMTNDNDIIVMKPDINGDKPDLIIVRPHTGILIINIFENNLGDYQFVTYEDEKGRLQTDYTQLANKDTKEELVSPLTRVETYWDNMIRLHIDGLMEKAIQNKKNWGIVKRMVFSAKNTTKEALDFFRSKDRYTNVIGKEILTDSSLQRNLLHNIYFDYYNNVFEEGMMRRFMRIISPGWHSYKEGKNIRLTTPQKNLVKSESNKKQKISGVAGSGKTQVLATRAVNAQLRTGGDILVLTFNIALANYMRYRMSEVRADFPWSKINITYYHRFFRSMANIAGLHVSFGSYEDMSFFSECEESLPKYDAIFIDEVQDYNTVWLQILNDNFLKVNGEFVVFGDPKQNVYHRPLDKQGDIRLEFIGGAWNHTLKDGMRFSNPQLAHLAYDFQMAFLNKELAEPIHTQPVQTDLMTCIKYANIGEIDDTQKLAHYCSAIFKKFEIAPFETVVLSQMGDILRYVDYYYRTSTGQKTMTTFLQKEGYDDLLEKHHIENDENAIANYGFKRDKEAIEHGLKERFTMDTNVLKLSTIHSYKGWEANSVILFIETENGKTTPFNVPSNLDTLELIYTAITRARENLYIINLGNSQYDSFFKAHIHN